MKRYKKIILSVVIVLIVVSPLLTVRVLRYTPELNIHRMRGAEDNVVYMSPDGHSEAVFDKNKQRVEDPINIGTYNYSHPLNEPFGHFVKDILPWLIWGNSPEDPTSFFERLYAYSKDLSIGFKIAIFINSKS